MQHGAVLEHHNGSVENDIPHTTVIQADLGTEPWRQRKVCHIVHADGLDAAEPRMRAADAAPPQLHCPRIQIETDAGAGRVTARVHDAEAARIVDVIDAAAPPEQKKTKRREQKKTNRRQQGTTSFSAEWLRVHQSERGWASFKINEKQNFNLFDPVSGRMT